MQWCNIACVFVIFVKQDAELLPLEKNFYEPAQIKFHSVSSIFILLIRSGFYEDC